MERDDNKMFNQHTSRNTAQIMKLIFVKILIGTSALNFSSLSNFQVTKELLKMERNEICGTDEPGFLFYKMYYM